MPEYFRIRIMPQAASDLVTICEFVERSSPQNAIAVARELLISIDSLEILPHRYKIHEHRKDPSKTVRSMPVPPFVVYYRVIDRPHFVEVRPFGTEASGGQSGSGENLSTGELGFEPKFFALSPHRFGVARANQFRRYGESALLSRGGGIASKLPICAEELQKTARVVARGKASQGALTSSSVAVSGYHVCGEIRTTFATPIAP